MQYLWSAVLLAVAAKPVGAQTEVDPRLLALPSSGSVRCVQGQRLAQPEILDAPGSVFTFHVGPPNLQVRNAVGQTVLTGPPPRVVVVTFSHGGQPMHIVDSLPDGWHTWVANVSFPTPIALSSYTQVTTIDSTEAIAIARRLGPARHQAIVD